MKGRLAVQNRTYHLELTRVFMVCAPRLVREICLQSLRDPLNDPFGDGGFGLLRQRFATSIRAQDGYDIGIALKARAAYAYVVGNDEIRMFTFQLGLRVVEQVLRFCSETDQYMRVACLFALQTNAKQYI